MEMGYEVWYRLQDTKEDWKSLGLVIADGFVVDTNGRMLNVRFFNLPDNTRIEMSVLNFCFKFSPKRMEVISTNIKQAKKSGMN